MSTSKSPAGTPAWVEEVMQAPEGPPSGAHPPRPWRRRSEVSTGSPRRFSVHRFGTSLRNVKFGASMKEISVTGSSSHVWGGASVGRHVSDEYKALSAEPVRVPDESLLDQLSVDELKTRVMNFQDMPSELAQVLRRYDIDGDGALDREESIHAAADLARIRHQIEQGIVHLHAFPQSAQPLLERHDLDGDGTLDVAEMIIAFEALERERNRARMWMRLALSAALFIFILLCSMSGLLYYVLQATKDSELHGTVLVVKETNEPVRTASMELTVKDGVLLDRHSRCAGERECPIQVAEASEKRAVSSQLPDETLNELRQLKVSSQEAWVQLRVFGVQRVPEAASEHGSVVVVYTHAGEALLDGARLRADERMQAVLERSGFTLAGTGSAMELQGDVLVQGSFNSV